MRIRSVASDDAEGPLKRIYDSSLEQFGFVPNIRRALSIAPDTLRAYMQLSGAVYSTGPLSPLERELVATAVSATNGCHY